MKDYYVLSWEFKYISSQGDFISKTQRSYYTLFIYPTLSSASTTIFYYQISRFTRMVKRKMMTIWNKINLTQM